MTASPGDHAANPGARAALARRALAIALVFGAGLAAAVLAAPGVARAQSSTPGAYYGREDPFERDEFFIGVGLGPGTFVTSEVEIGSFGPHLSLRLGTPGSSRLLWMVQIDHYFARRAGGDMDGGKRVNFIVYTVAAQRFLIEKVWLKGGLGLSTITEGEGERELASGLAGTLAMGTDVYRRGGFVLGLELVINAGLHGDDLDTGSGLGLAGTWY